MHPTFVGNGRSMRVKIKIKMVCATMVGYITMRPMLTSEEVNTVISSIGTKGTLIHFEMSLFTSSTVVFARESAKTPARLTRMREWRS